MSIDEDDFEYEAIDTDVDENKPRDSKIDEAKSILLDRYFQPSTLEVYYGRQLEIWMEREFFHWITKKALNELAKEGRIQFNIEQLQHHKAHFYTPRRHRYNRRQINEVIGIIARFSHPQFTRAVGHHGELLAQAGFARAGFRIVQHRVRAVDGKAWTKSNHDLDFLIERDGIRYGVEIKNQLGYIDQTEFQIKREMCQYFGIRSFFMCRMMPANYTYSVVNEGGYCFMTQNQNYPLLADDLAKLVRDRLKLPVQVTQVLPDTALKRFEAWHERQTREG